MRFLATLFFCSVMWSLVVCQGILEGIGDVVQGLGNAVGGTSDGGDGGQDCDCAKHKDCATCATGGLGALGETVGDAPSDSLAPLAGQDCGNCSKGMNCQSCQSNGLGGILEGLAGNALGDLTSPVEGVLAALQPVVGGLFGTVQGLLGHVLNLVSAIEALLLETLGLAGPDISRMLGPLVSLLNSTGAEGGQGGLVSSLLDNLKQVVSQILGQAGGDAATILGPLVPLLDKLSKEAGKIGGHTCPCGQNTNDCSCSSRNSRDVSGMKSPINTTETATMHTTTSAAATATTTTVTSDEGITTWQPENDFGPNGEVLCPGRYCLSDCILMSCRVVCLETGCTVNELLVTGTFQDILTQAKKLGLGYAGTITGLADDEEDDGLFEGQLGQALSQAGFNPNAFIGSFGRVPDMTERFYKDGQSNVQSSFYGRNGGRKSTVANYGRSNGQRRSNGQQKVASASISKGTEGQVKIASSGTNKGRSNGQQQAASASASTGTEGQVKIASSGKNKGRSNGRRRSNDQQEAASASVSTGTEGQVKAASSGTNGKGSTTAGGLNNKRTNVRVAPGCPVPKDDLTKDNKKNQQTKRFAPGCPAPKDEDNITTIKPSATKSSKRLVRNTKKSNVRVAPGCPVPRDDLLNIKNNKTKAQNSKKRLGKIPTKTKKETTANKTQKRSKNQTGKYKSKPTGTIKKLKRKNKLSTTKNNRLTVKNVKPAQKKSNPVGANTNITTEANKLTATANNKRTTNKPKLRTTASKNKPTRNKLTVAKNKKAMKRIKRPNKFTGENKERATSRNKLQRRTTIKDRATNDKQKSLTPKLTEVKGNQRPTRTNNRTTGTSNIKSKGTSNIRQTGASNNRATGSRITQPMGTKNNRPTVASNKNRLIQTNKKARANKILETIGATRRENNIQTIGNNGLTGTSKIMQKLKESSLTKDNDKQTEMDGQTENSLSTQKGKMSNNTST